MLKRLTAALTALAFGCTQVAAEPPLMGNIIGKQAFHGPGSRGFLPTCSGQFSVTNVLPYSAAFNAWGPSGSTGLVPSTPTSGAADPLGGTTAYSVTFPAVSPGKFSIIASQPTTAAQEAPAYFGVWAKITSGTGPIFISQTEGSTYDTAQIPNDGNWHLVLTQATQGQFSDPGFQIGVNLNDTTHQTASAGATVSLWNAFYTSAQIAPYFTAGNFPSSLQTGAYNVTNAVWNGTTQTTFTLGATPSPALTGKLIVSGVVNSPTTPNGFNLSGNGFTIASTSGNTVTVSQTSNPGTYANSGFASAPVTQTVTMPCPTMPNGQQIAFRNFNPQLPAAGLRPLNTNALPNYASNLYESGGVSNPYVTPQMFYGGYYWAFVNATSAPSHGDWMSFALYKSTDKINWVEDTLNAPYLQAYGSVLAKPTVVNAGSGYGTSVSGTLTYSGCTVPLVINVTTTSGGAIGTSPAPTYVSGSCSTFPGGGNTGWTPGGGLSAGTGATFSFASVIGTGGTNASVWFQLHPQWLPYGCNVSGTAYPFCIVYTGNSTAAGNSQDIYLAYSSTIDGVYTPYGCTAGGGVCAVQTPISPSGYTNQYAVSVVNVGGINGLNYIYSMNAGQTSVFSNVFTTPANPNTATGGSTTAGNTLTFVNTGLQTNLSTDWDTTSPGNNYKQDNHVYRNRCGFYEYFYTATNTSSTLPGGLHQNIAYLISNNPNGPWWKYSGSIIPPRSPLINGTNNIGDASVTSIGGRYLFWSNSDAGINPSKATIAVMQDACAY
jgi:hypothetical protein